MYFDGISLTWHRTSINGESVVEYAANGEVTSVAGLVTMQTASTDGDGNPFAAVRHRENEPTASTSEPLIRRLMALERRLSILTGREDVVSTMSKSQRLELSDRDPPNLPNGLDVIPEQHVLPEMGHRSWDDFINKIYGSPNYAIEILVEDPEYYFQSANATTPTKQRGMNHDGTRTPRVGSSPRVSSRPQNMTDVPNRVRINSPIILKALKGLDENVDESASLVMLRPFKFLVHHEGQIREMITSVQNNPVTTDTSDLSHVSGLLDAEQDNRSETLSHMTCLGSFIDRHISPTLARFRDISQKNVRFTELWYVFQPGDDIYMPFKVQNTDTTSDEVTPDTFSSCYNRTWRVTGVSGGRRNLRSAQNKRNAGLRPNPFRVYCYFIDFHGRYFRPTVHTFEIAPFKGERPIDSLDFYPRRYMEATHRKIALEDTVNRGKMIFDAMARSLTAHVSSP
jgi:hypothetical protein